MTATVQIPGMPITLIAAAQLLAGAVSKDNPDAVSASLNFILEKAHRGELRGRHPLTLVPFDTAGISPADYANLLVLTPNDLRQLATECDLRVEADDVLKSAHSTQAAPAPAQNTATPAPVVDSASNAPVVKAKATHRTWWGISSAYIVQVIQAGQYATCKELYRALEAKAGPNAPFDKGTGANRGSLFVREIARPLSLKTVQNHWQALQELAKK